MIGNQVALVRRELWEHRSLYVVPAVLGAIIVLIQMTGQTAVSAFGTHIDMALLGATNIGPNERGAFIAGLLTVLSGLLVLEMLVLTTFYSLDSLYAERKDKSILFWRSMPVTDAETVISKLLTAIIVIPLITLAFIAATHLLVLLVSSIWVGMRGANGWHLIWSAVPLLDTWGATLIFMLALTLWLSPFIGWFLLVSAYTKRSPMLMAILPIVVLPMLERSIMKTTMLADALFVRTGSIPIYRDIDLEDLFSKEALQAAAENGISLISMLDVGRFVSSPGLWLGLTVCGLLTTAAMYVRRFRDES
jgi:ABC-2 type transport system permease protein